MMTRRPLRWSGINWTDILLAAAQSMWPQRLELWVTFSTFITLEHLSPAPFPLFVDFLECFTCQMKQNAKDWRTASPFQPFLLRNEHVIVQLRTKYSSLCPFPKYNRVYVSASVVVCLLPVLQHDGVYLLLLIIKKKLDNFAEKIHTNKESWVIPKTTKRN